MLLKKKKIPRYVIDVIEISSDSDRESPDEENSYKENSNEENTKNTNVTHIYSFLCVHI